MPDDPLLADKGSLSYWLICLACHGDKGQGLTDEFRREIFGEDMNCWQSKCHASNHPQEGFDLPRVVPAIVGPGTLSRFLTAEDLNQYILSAMPWWNPGSLSSNEAWELTAYILRENGSLPQNVEFIPQTASSAPVHLPIRSRTNEQSWQWVFLISMTLVAGALIAGSVVKSGATAAQPVKGATRPSFMHHLHPPSIPLPQARWRYTLGAGGLAIYLSLVLGVTGILLMFFYIPTPEHAGPSIQTITFLVPFGSLIRGIHYWAAQALVIVALIHLLRVIFTGSFVTPRRFNFFIGLGLLVLTLFLDFTGYVLRWDEGIRWALTVGTNLLQTIPLIGTQVYGFVIGGDKPGLAALTRFYAWHIFGLTLVMVVLIAWHIFRVRRDGGISAPSPEQRGDTRRISRFELVQREGLAAVLATLALILVGALIPAPLAVPIQDMTLAPPEDVRAPWFFLWIQQLLRYGDAFWMGIAVPCIILIVLIVLPYLFPKIPDSQKGRWFPRAGRAAQLIAGGITIGWLILTIMELLE